MDSIKKHWILLLFLTSFTTSFFTSCVSEDKYLTDSSIKLKFSTDTLRFDTIFTSMGSITKQVMIYNKESKPIKIDYISLGGGRNSFYRLNVSGDTSIVAKNIEIAPNDSLYIFARVTINPNNQNNPLLVQDSIIISFNNKQQFIQLEAFGQDAYYHISKRELIDNLGNKSYFCYPDDGSNSGCEINGNILTWKNDKPHIIYGTCVVSPDKELRINQGTKIHLNKSSNIYIEENASINISGNPQEPSIIQGMRNDGHYFDAPGQWGGIYISSKTKKSSLKNVLIKNGSIGLSIDSSEADIENLRIENMSLKGLVFNNSIVKGENIIVQNTRQESVALIGGDYEFIHCTFVNYWPYDSPRKYPTLLLKNYTNDNNPLKVHFYNSIIYGSNYDNEIELDNKNNILFDYYFTNCIIKSTFIKTNLTDCILNKDPLFNEVKHNDLRLKESSPAINNGSSSWRNNYDIDGDTRNNPPSIGAYEYKTINQSKSGHYHRK